MQRRAIIGIQGASAASEPKDQQQLKREKDAVHEAATKYREQLEEHPETHRMGRALICHHWELLADVIRAEQERLCAPETSARKYRDFLLALGADSMAVITLHSIIGALNPESDIIDEMENSGALDELEELTAPVDGSDRQEMEQPESKLTVLVKKIGWRCGYQYFLSEKDRESGFSKSFQNKEAKRRAKKRAAVRVNSDWSASNSDFHVGAVLLKLALEAKIIKIEKGRKQRGTRSPPNVVRLGNDFSEAMEQWKATDDGLGSPLHRPMVVAPVPWKGLEGGGYLSNAENKSLPLVKHHGRQEIIAALKTVHRAGRLRQVFTAVNGLQETRWRINKRILAIMQEAKKRLSKEEEFKKSKKSDLINGLRTKLKACADLEHEEVIFFPYDLDFRGRAYCIPQIVNPQSDDIGRTLLEFADGKPLGERGRYWLAVHVANAYGKDKLPFEERIAWVEQETARIGDMAAKPLECRGWMDAKKPWRFLAACLEWADYCSVGSGLRSHLPIAMDGTCNGFQHLSALRLDEHGAKVTNLQPSESPQDLYRDVAVEVQKVLETDRANGDVHAEDWLENVGNIDRDTVKQAVMTTPYGATPYRMTHQFLDQAFTENLKTPEWTCIYFVAKVRECIAKLVDEGGATQEWLKRVAKLFAEKNRGVRWTAPSGFPVVHKKYIVKEKRISAAGYSLTTYVPKEPPKVSETKQQSGIVPHFVHSLDASHMILTINQLLSQGLRHFGVVHDGYAVHACDVDVLHVALREQFVEIYQTPVLKGFRCRQELEAVAEIPPTPPLGSFDIRLVRESKYFFC